MGYHYLPKHAMQTQIRLLHKDKSDDACKCFTSHQQLRLYGDGTFFSLGLPLFARWQGYRLTFFRQEHAGPLNQND